MRGGGRLCVVGGQGFHMFKEERNPRSGLMLLLTSSLFMLEFWAFISFTHCIQKHLVLVFVKMVIGLFVGGLSSNLSPQGGMMCT